MSQVLKRVKGLDQGAEAILKRPKLAAMIAATATRWTRIENMMTELFIGLLSEEEQDELAAFLEFRTQKRRNEAFLIRAMTILTPDSFKVFEKISKRMHKKSKQRNLFIHGLRATSEQHPDSLLLIDANQYHEEDMRFKNMPCMTLDEQKKYLDTLWERCRITKYVEKDFRSALDNIAGFENEVWQFRHTAKFKARPASPSRGSHGA